MHSQVARLNAAQDTMAAAAVRLSEAVAEMERYAVERREALHARDALQADAGRLTDLMHQAQADTDGAMPSPGFWALPDAEFYGAAP